MAPRLDFDVSALPADVRGGIRAARRRLNLAIAAGHGSRAVAAVVMGAGVLVLTAKLLACDFMAAPPWAVAAGALTAVAAYALFRRGVARERPFGDRDAAILYDLATRGGGLPLALAERPSPEWGVRVRSLPVTPVRLRPLRLVRPVVVPALFLAGALVVPARRPPEARPDHAFRRAAADAAETADALLEAEILRPEALERIRREIEELESRPSAERSWEALDTMEERMASQLSEAADALAWGMEATDALAESPADESRRRELESALAKLGLAGALGELPPDLARSLSRSGEGDGTLPSDPEALRRTLRALSSHLERKAGKTCASSSRCKGAATLQALEDLEAYLDERLRAGPADAAICLTPEQEKMLYAQGGT